MSNATKTRRCYYTNESFGTREESTGLIVYELVCVHENEAGYLSAGKYTSLVNAQTAMNIRNAVEGISKGDVLDIVASSIRQGMVRR